MSRTIRDDAPSSSYLRRSKPTRAAYSIEEVAVCAGIGRDKIYAELRSGRLEAVKAGRRTLITADALRSYLERLPKLRLVEGG